MRARLFVTLTLVLGAVALGELVGARHWRLYDDVVQTVAGAAAAWVCFAAALNWSVWQRNLPLL